MRASSSGASSSNSPKYLDARLDTSPTAPVASGLMSKPSCVEQRNPDERSSRGSSKDPRSSDLLLERMGGLRRYSMNSNV